MKYKSSAKDRVMKALKGEENYHVPFTVYRSFLEMSKFEREMRERGMGYVHMTRSYDIIQKEASIREIRYVNDIGLQIIRTEYETPFKTLFIEQTPKPEHMTTVTTKHIFKDSGDYKALQWLIKDMKVMPNYDRANDLTKFLGDDFIIRDSMPLEPLQSLITDIYMDTCTFCIEWHDNRDEIMRLYDIFRELNRNTYGIVAQGPLEIVNYGGNVIPAVIGRQNFIDYYVPNYNEAAEVVHKNGKLIGAHFDDNNAPIMDEIGATFLDYIEAYDPVISPYIDAAFEKFKDKAIWINWPSGWHNSDISKVYEFTQDLIKSVKKGDKFLIGVTENMPLGKERELIPLILDAIQDMGR